MYSIRFEWKSFNLNLGLIDAYLKSQIADLYAGNSADTGLTMWFTGEPTDEQKVSVQAYWDSITEESDEANYVSSSQITARIAELKDGLTSKSWDEMSIAERKLVTSQNVSNTELGF